MSFPPALPPRMSTHLSLTLVAVEKLERVQVRVLSAEPGARRDLRDVLDLLRAVLLDSKHALP